MRTELASYFKKRKAEVQVRDESSLVTNNASSAANRNVDASIEEATDAAAAAPSTAPLPDALISETIMDVLANVESTSVQTVEQIQQTPEPWKPLTTMLKRDEFREIDTKRSIFLRAARLTKAQDKMDSVSTSDEAQLVLSQLDKEKVRLKFNSFSDVVTIVPVVKLWYGMTLTSAVEVTKKIQVARNAAEHIRKELDLLTSPEDQEERLMKHFIAHMFSTGYQHSIVAKYFLGDTFDSKQDAYTEYRQLFALIMLPCLTVILVYFIVAFSIQIGPRAITLWSVVFLILLVQKFFFQEPLKFWIKWILLYAPVAKELRATCEALNVRSRLILRRTTGVVMHFDDLVQHFNPACRVARLYPSLPISRLLMSMNDLDIKLKPDSSIWALLSKTASSVLFCALNAPESLRDTCADVGVSALIDFVLIAVKRNSASFSR